MKNRRQEEQIKKEKLKYWHLIKRDVLKHKKEIAFNEAMERLEQAKKMKQWAKVAHVRALMERVWEMFS